FFGVNFGSPGEAFAGEAIAEAVRAAAVSPGEAGLLDIAAAGRHVRAVGLAGVSGDDVDDPIDGIGTPNRAARAADDLGAVDIVDHHVLHVPIHTRKERGVD